MCPPQVGLARERRDPAHRPPACSRFAPRRALAAGGREQRLLRSPRAGPGSQPLPTGTGCAGPGVAAKRRGDGTPACTRWSRTPRTSIWSATRASSPSIQQLITGWHDTPAFVQGRRLDVLASNTLATNLSPLFTPGENLLRAIFLVPDPASRALYGDQWESLAHSAIAGACAHRRRGR